MVAAGNGRASRLAQRLALGKPAISAAVDSLVARGLIVRSSLDPDRRVTLLEITAMGSAALAAAEAAMSAELADLLRHAPDRAAALVVLRNLSLALDGRQAARDAGAAKARVEAGSTS
jgi:DNA-binding MarR family transcriptional regulator